MAGTNLLVKKDKDQETEDYYKHPDRSECLSSTLDWTDAVEAVNKGCADFIARNPDNGDRWSAFRLLPEFEAQRTQVVEMTKRLHKLTFGRSRA